MTEHRPHTQLAAADPGQVTITQRPPSGDHWDIKHALMTCLALALLGALAATTGVAMVAYLLLTNSHV
jgi:hypothetical protein